MDVLLSRLCLRRLRISSPPGCSLHLRAKLHTVCMCALDVSRLCGGARCTLCPGRRTSHSPVSVARSGGATEGIREVGRPGLPRKRKSAEIGTESLVFGVAAETASSTLDKG